MKTRSSSERLGEKSARALLTNHFRERYNYNPAMTEAILKDTVFVHTLLEPGAREDGQIIRYFPKALEKAGKPLKHCEYVAVRLTLYASGDDESLTFSIVDNGRGLSKVESDKLMQRLADAQVLEHDGGESNRSIGMVNIQKRIRLYYGDEYGVSIRANRASGALTVVRLPVDCRRPQLLKRVD